MVFDITVNYAFRYTLTDADKENMRQRGWTPGIQADEHAWLDLMLRIRPELVIEAYAKSGAWEQYGEFKFPPGLNTIIYVGP